MNLKTYQKAKRYANKIKYTYPIDLVHDSYLKWYDKTGLDLFDEPEGRVMSILWKECSNAIRRGQWMYNGVRYPKIYFEFRELGLKFQGDMSKEYPPHQYNPITPEDILIGKDLITKLVELKRKCEGQENNTHTNMGFKD